MTNLCAMCIAQCLNIDGKKLGKLSHTAGDYNCTHWLLYSEKKKKKKEEKQSIYLSILIKFRTGHSCQILDIWLRTPDH